MTSGSALRAPRRTAATPRSSRCADPPPLPVGAVGETEQRLELAGDPCRLGGFRDHVVDRRAELGLGPLFGLAFEDAGV